MGFKKITVRTYDEDGRFRVKMDMTLVKTVDAVDFNEAKQKVQKIVESQPVGERYAVEWNRGGFPEGYRI